jgi:hypothetical protein
VYIAAMTCQLGGRRREGQAARRQDHMQKVLEG